MRESQGSRRPWQKRKNGFEIVAREDTSGEFQKSLEAAQKILSENSDIVAIMCGNDQMAVGAKTAMNVAEQGSDPHLWSRWFSGY